MLKKFLNFSALLALGEKDPYLMMALLTVSHHSVNAEKLYKAFPSVISDEITVVPKELVRCIIPYGLEHLILTLKKQGCDALKLIYRHPRKDFIGTDMPPQGITIVELEEGMFTVKNIAWVVLHHEKHVDFLGREQREEHLFFCIPLALYQG